MCPVSSKLQGVFIQEMTVEEVRDISEEEEKEELAPDEARRRLRRLAWEHPDLIFAMFEALMDHLGISEEDQNRIVKEGARKWAAL